MNIYTPSQRKALNEMKEDKKHLVSAITKIEEENVLPHPINLVLEARIISLFEKGIKLEAEIEFLRNQDEIDEETLLIKQLRHRSILGGIRELEQTIELLYKISSISHRGFGVIDVEQLNLN